MCSTGHLQQYEDTHIYQYEDAYTCHYEDTYDLDIGHNVIDECLPILQFESTKQEQIFSEWVLDRGNWGLYHVEDSLVEPHQFESQS